MKYLKILSILSISFIFQACPLQDDDDIEIGVMNLKNYYEETIYYCMDYSQLELDVSETCFKSMIAILEYPINSKENKKFKVFKGMFADNRKIHLLIYKQSTLNNYTWEVIQSENIYDKRYSFTLEDLKVMNWTIVYDGE